ncbi:MAG: CocE/NonD family hydrolase [Sphingobacteriales bacterium]|jgi:putative CocE/NonD family hydrolase
MKKLVIFAFLLLSLGASAQQSLDSAYIRENYVKIERMIPMRDGVKLFTAIYLPKDKSEKHPILMTRTPYSCAPYGETNYRPYWNTYHRLYFRENYIIVQQDVRGRFMSEGVFEDVRPYNGAKKTNQEIDEASDTYDTIDWLLKNIENNNGKVGAFGISYPGFYATMAALSGHPALVAVSPQAPVTEWFLGDDFHHNGALMLMDGFSFYTRFGVPRPNPVKTYVGGYQIKGDDNYQFYLRAGSLTNIAKLMGDSIKFWKDLYAHPNYDTFWQARNARNNVTGIKPAMLVVGGLYDAEDCYGAWRLYEAIEQKNPASQFNKIVMGPWYHGQWASNEGGARLGNATFKQRTSDWYQNNIEVPFFNYHLKGKGNINQLKEATVFMTGKNEWKQYDVWPPAEAKDQSLYFQPGKQLSWIKPATTAAASTYVSDPAHPVPYADGIHMGRTREYMTDDQRFASRRPDVLTFETPVLTEDLTVTGTVIADLKVTLSTTDADFVVKIIDVYPDDYKDSELRYPLGGAQMLVRGEIMRGKFRNSFEKPEPFKPGKVETVKFELPDISHCFKKGHKLMIQVQSSWFPLADRNPQQFMNIYQAEDKDFVPATIQLHHDAKNSSAIILPVLSGR